MSSLDRYNLILWRDSVCAGDDCDAPHERVFTGSPYTLRQFAEEIIRTRYLPSIAGGRATWILYTEAGSRALAVLAQQWREPEFLVDPERDVQEYVEPAAQPHLHLTYWCQAEPKAVLECLRHGRSMPNRYGCEK